MTSILVDMVHSDNQVDLCSLHLFYFSFFFQDGLRLSIKFSTQSEYELDADTQEDKNKVSVEWKYTCACFILQCDALLCGDVQMCRLLEAISRRKYLEGGQQNLLTNQGSSYAEGLLEDSQGSSPAFSSQAGLSSESNYICVYNNVL